MSTNNLDSLRRALAKAPDRIRAAIAKAVEDQNDKTIGHISTHHMHGPRPGKLAPISHHLVRSLRATKPQWNGDVLESSIGTNVVYAAAHEFGFHGPVQVRAHTRKVSRSKSGTKKGKTRTLSESQVRAHTRQVNIPARSPIGAGIKESLPAYSASISKAVSAVLQTL
jgi:phage gpG-like protein